MNTQYYRVIPRDLFNESKLLKCIGRLIILIGEKTDFATITYEQDGEPFNIGLHDDGYLGIDNISFLINDTYVLLKSQYNSKSNYPLVCEYEYCEYLVLDENGDYTDEFKNFCQTL